MTAYLNRTWLVVVGLAILVLILRLPTLEEPFDIDSGANAYHARLIFRGEPLYSTHHTAHHLPGVYYTYVLAYMLFGDSIWSVKFLLIPWTILTAFSIYKIGFRLKDNITGILAAVFYIILNSQILLKGDAAGKEIFANLPITASILLGMELILNRSKSWKFLFVGALCAIAFLYKPVFLFPIIVTSIMIVVNAWLNKHISHSSETAFLRILWGGIGFIIILFIVVGMFARLGLFSRFMMVFTFGQNYVDQITTNSSFISILILPIYILVFNNIILLLLSMGGCVRILRRTSKKYQTNQAFTIISLGIISWYILSIFTAGITRRGWNHYSLIIIPPLTILAAWEIGQLHRKFIARRNNQKRYLSLIPFFVLLAAVIFFSGLSNYKFYYHYSRYKLGIDTYEEFLVNGSFLEGTGMVASQKIAAYIRDNTTPDDFIYAWSDNVQIYYLADRRAPIEFIWPINAEAADSYKFIFLPQTKYIIVGESILAVKPEWLNEGLEISYTLEKVIEEHNIYRRIDQ